MQQFCLELIHQTLPGVRFGSFLLFFQHLAEVTNSLYVSGWINMRVFFGSFFIFCSTFTASQITFKTMISFSWSNVGMVPLSSRIMENTDLRVYDYCQQETIIFGYFSYSFPILLLFIPNMLFLSPKKWKELLLWGQCRIGEISSPLQPSR